MLTMKELIENGVAPSHYINTWEPNESDRFSINYNNIFGCISDTYMHKSAVDDSYIITGSLFKDRVKTQQFVYACEWCKCRFSDSSLHVNSLMSYANSRLMTISHEVLNGDDVLVCRPMTEEQKAAYERSATLNCDRCCPCAGDACTDTTGYNYSSFTY